jgi:hypothetical protein
VTIKVIVFDIGGVLESEAPFDSWHGPWRDRLGLSTAQFRAAWATIDPDDDWPANVTAASEAGIHAVLHRTNAESIAAVTALLDR